MQVFYSPQPCGNGLPVALAGGYIGRRLGERSLVDLHLLTISAAAQNTI